MNGVEPAAARCTWSCCADWTAAFIQNAAIALVILGTLWSAVMTLGTAGQLGWGLAITLAIFTTTPNIPFNTVAVTRFRRLESGRQIGAFLLAAVAAGLATVYMEAGAEQATCRALPIDAWAEEHMGTRVPIQILNFLVQFATAFPTMTTLLREHAHDGRSLKERYFGSTRSAITLNTIGHLVNLGRAIFVTWDLYANMTVYANNPSRQSIYNFLFDAMRGDGGGSVMLHLLCSVPEGLFFIRGNHLTQEMIPDLYTDLQTRPSSASFRIGVFSTVWTAFSGGTYIALGVQAYRANPGGGTLPLVIASGAAVAAAGINYEACIRTVQECGKFS